jgi:FeoB-associated Cys-rich membrane protein
MDWQAIVVAVLVLTAAVYLAGRAYRSFSRPGCGDGCSGCSSKGSGDAKGPESLVQIRIRKKKDDTQ